MGQLVKNNEYSGSAFTYTSGNYTVNGNYRANADGELTELSFNGNVTVQDSSAMAPVAPEGGNFSGNLWSMGDPANKRINISEIPVGKVAEIGAVIDEMVDAIIDSLEPADAEN